MNMFSSADKESEVRAFVLLALLLGGYSLANVLVGPFWPAFFGLVVPAAVLAFLYPRAGLFVSVAMTVFFERFYTLSPLVIGEAQYKVYALDAVLAASFVSALLLWMREGKRFSRFRSSDWLLLSFFGIVTAIFLFELLVPSETNVATAFSTWKNYVFYGALFFLVSYGLRTRDDIFFFARLFLWSVAAAGIFLLIGIARGGGLWTEYTPLSTAGTRFLAFPHAFYFSLGFLSIFFSSPFWLVDPRRSRLLFWLSAVLIAGILGSLMRHLWLGIGGAMVFGFLFFPSEYRRAFIRTALPFLAVAASSLLIFWSALALFPQSDIRGDTRYVADILSERIFSIGNRYDESLAWREGVWTSAMAEFRRSPIFGIGFGAQVPVELGDYRSYVEVRNMHNSWLAMLIQTGLVGAAVFLGFLVSLCLTLFRAHSGDRFFGAMKYGLMGLIVFQCLVFFSQPYLETNLLGIFFWITLGVARAVTDMPKSKPAQRIGN